MRDKITQKQMIFVGFMIVTIPILAFADLDLFSLKYFYTKWFLLHATSTFLLISEIILIKSRSDYQIYLPSNKKILIGFALILIGYFISIFANLNYNYWNQTLSLICGIQIVRTSFFLSLQNSRKIITTLNLVLIFSIFVVFATFLVKKDQFNFSLDSNNLLNIYFGNRNFLAEFCGVSYIVQFFLLTKKKLRDKITTILLLIPLLVTIVIIATTLCRTVWVAVVISSIHCLFRQRKILSKEKIFFLCSIIILSCISLPISQFFYKTNKGTVKISFNETKNTSESAKNITYSSAKIRISRWGNTLYMIKDNIWGIGPGNFEFNYVRYHNSWSNDIESTKEIIIKSPHNGYLELIVEGGFISFMGLLLLIYTVFFDQFQPTILKELSISYFALFSVYAMFAFPLETAINFYLFSIFLGMYLSTLTYKKTRIILKKKIVFFARHAVFCIVFIIFSICSISYFLEYRSYYYLDDITFACNIFPENWRACIRKAELELEQKNTTQAIDTLKKILSKSPNNFHAMNTLSMAYFINKDYKNGCLVASEFDQIFLNMSSLHEIYKNNCTSHPLTTSSKNL